jgi:hypothetical protein
MSHGEARRVILWALCVVLGSIGFGILSLTVLLLIWQMVEAGLLWVVILIAAMFGLYVAVTLWGRYRERAAPRERPDEISAAADLW